MGKLIVLFLLLFFSHLDSQNLLLSTDPPYDQSNDIRTYLMRAAAEISESALSRFTRLEQWTSVAEKRRQQFIDMMGLCDVPVNGERPPLNVRIVDTCRMEGYRIV
ncbi:MAG: hypothetical protein EHM72_15945, partial [Calditrichaeota bacterium]